MLECNVFKLNRKFQTTSELPFFDLWEGIPLKNIYESNICKEKLNQIVNLSFGSKVLCYLTIFIGNH